MKLQTSEVGLSLEVRNAGNECYVQKTVLIVAGGYIRLLSELVCVPR